MIQAAADERVSKAERELALLVKEVMQVRLEFGPNKSFGSRWTLYATMEDNFMRYGHQLKEVADVIMHMLPAMLLKEFRMIDFGRAKPVDQGLDHRKPPLFRIDLSGDPMDRTR